MTAAMNPALHALLARRESLIARVKKILVESLYVPLPPDAIDLDVALFGTGLGLDSVDALELVVATESAFGVTFPEAVLRHGLRTVNSLVDLVVVLEDEKAAK
jgi:acyl carrier protein